MVKSFAKSSLGRMGRNTEMFADFCPREALQAKNDHFPGPSITGSHHFVQEHGGFNPNLC